MIECCVEFITLISSEANEISEKESKKTIACEHITKALEQLGFGEYVQDIMEVANEHKEALKVGDLLSEELQEVLLILYVRDERRKQTNWNKVDYPRKSYLLYRRRLSEMQPKDMDS